MEPRIAYSVREAAKQSEFSEESIYLAIRRGELKAAPPGGHRNMRILHEDLVAWLRAEGVEQRRRKTPREHQRDRAA